MDPTASTNMNGVGSNNAKCLSGVLDAGYTWSLEDGFDILLVPYSVCRKECGRFGMFPLYAITLLLFQFILPAIAFSITVPRRWHLDLPMPLLRFKHNGAVKMVQIPVCAVALIVLKTIDILLWIGAIFTLAGPSIFSGVQETLLDYRVVKALNNSTLATGTDMLNQVERFQLIVALLCGNFEDHEKDVESKIHRRLCPRTALDRAKVQLQLVLTSQPDYGIFVGIPTLFFLGGFWYNSLVTKDSVAVGAFYVQFATFWLIPVFVAMVCGVVLTGQNPSSVSAVALDNYSVQTKSWSIIRDSYVAEVYPVNIWDRGTKKLEWLGHTDAWQLDWFAQKVRFGFWAWAFTTGASLLLVLTPCIVAIEMSLHFKFPRQSCATFAFYMYAAAQTYLVAVSAVGAITRKRYRALVKPWLGLSQIQMLHRYLQWFVTWIELQARWFFVMLGFMALLIAALVSYVGNIAQVFGLYQHCFCSSSITQWIKPTSSWMTIIAVQADKLGVFQSREALATRMIWGVSVSVMVVCYLGWVYQRILRRAVLDQIRDL